MLLASDGMSSELNDGRSEDHAVEANPESSYEGDQEASIDQEGPSCTREGHQLTVAPLCAESFVSQPPSRQLWPSTMTPARTLSGRDLGAGSSVSTMAQDVQPTPPGWLPHLPQPQTQEAQMDNLMPRTWALAGSYQGQLRTTYAGPDQAASHGLYTPAPRFDWAGPASSQAAVNPPQRGQTASPSKFWSSTESPSSPGREESHGSPGVQTSAPVAASTSTSQSLPPAAETTELGPEMRQQALRSDGGPRRPMNAFLLFSRYRRKEAQLGGGVSITTAQFSAMLGEEWRNLPEERRAFWREQAAQVRTQFQRQFPSYRYSRNKKKAKEKGGGSGESGHSRISSFHQDGEHNAEGSGQHTATDLFAYGATGRPALEYPGRVTLHAVPTSYSPFNPSGWSSTHSQGSIPAASASTSVNMHPYEYAGRPVPGSYSASTGYATTNDWWSTAASTTVAMPNSAAQTAPTALPHVPTAFTSSAPITSSSLARQLVSPFVSNTTPSSSAGVSPTSSRAQPGEWSWPTEDPRGRYESRYGSSLGQPDRLAPLNLARTYGTSEGTIPAIFGPQRVNSAPVATGQPSYMGEHNESREARWAGASLPATYAAPQFSFAQAAPTSVSTLPQASQSGGLFGSLAGDGQALASSTDSRDSGTHLQAQTSGDYQAAAATAIDRKSSLYTSLRQQPTVQPLTATSQTPSGTASATLPAETRYGEHAGQDQGTADRTHRHLGLLSMLASARRSVVSSSGNPNVLSMLNSGVDLSTMPIASTTAAAETYNVPVSSYATAAGQDGQATEGTPGTRAGEGDPVSTGFDTTFSQQQHLRHQQQHGQDRDQEQQQQQQQDDNS
ncbi:hypothetical protein V8E36_006541 [Tilletia maclaganii]